MKNKAIVLIALVLSPLVSRIAWAQTPSEATVKAAITRIMTKPSEAKAGDLQTIISFAEKSDKVIVEAIPGLVPLGSSEEDKQTNPIFIGYYVAGAVLFDLAHPKLAKDSLADKSASVKAMLIAYRALQKKNPGYKQPLLEKLAGLDKSGKLDGYIRSTVGTKKAK